MTPTSRYCVACGAGWPRPDATFCNQCGALLVKVLEDIWTDTLPVYHKGTQLPPEEVCHARRNATYDAATGRLPRRQGTIVHGTLLITDRRLLFRSKDLQRPIEANWTSVAASEYEQGTIYIRVPASVGSGFYLVNYEIEYLMAMIRRLVDQARPVWLTAGSRSRAGVVYLFRRSDNEYKVGESEDPIRRYREHTTQGAHRGVPVHEITTNDRLRLEAHWLDYFYRKRQGNPEWFDLTPEEIAEFLSFGV